MMIFLSKQEQGFTVEELKRFLDTYPNGDENGDPNEVWMVTGKGLSSPMVSITRLNTNDILIGY